MLSPGEIKERIEQLRGKSPYKSEWYRGWDAAIDAVLVTLPSVAQQPQPRQPRIVEWATSCFGTEQMSDPKVRALRLLEESIEFAQAVGVEIGRGESLLKYVYTREPGKPDQELGGVGVTWMAAAQSVGVLAEDCLDAEMARVFAKPRDHFTKRNQVKVDAGFGPASATPQTLPSVEELAEMDKAASAPGSETQGSGTASPTTASNSEHAGNCTTVKSVGYSPSSASSAEQAASLRSQLVEANEIIAESHAAYESASKRLEAAEQQNGRMPELAEKLVAAESALRQCQTERDRNASSDATLATLSEIVFGYREAGETAIIDRVKFLLSLESRESVAIDYDAFAKEWVERQSFPNEDPTYRANVARLVASALRSFAQKRGRQPATIERPEILEYLWREQGCPGTVQEFPTLAAQFTGSSLALVIERWEKWRNDLGPRESVEKGLVRALNTLFGRCGNPQCMAYAKRVNLAYCGNCQIIKSALSSYRQATQPGTESPKDK